MTTRVLVTGATGFLGRHVLAALAQRPDVVAIAACRRPDRLPDGFTGEVRRGDLTDPGYRRSVVEDIDVVCHTGTWGAFWGHARVERAQFFAPAVDLIDQSVRAGVRRFILASSVVIAPAATGGDPVSDRTPPSYTGFWPHADLLVDVDRHMRARSGHGTQMVAMRLGHFVGAGNRMGVVPALVPRLRTRLVPWLAGGRARMPLVAGGDLGEAFALAATADGLADYESFNICGPDFPTSREVINLIAAEAGVPRPRFSVPYRLGHAFGWLMETLHPVLPGAAPFLTRSIVHVSRDWWCPTDNAERRLGYVPRVGWRTAVRETLADLAADNYPWPRLAQEVQ